MKGDTMLDSRRMTVTLGSAVLLASSLAVVGAAPAHADGKDREFRVGGAEVDFKVEKDDGRFEIEVDLDDARPRSTWRVVLRHNGKRFFKRTLRADSDGEFDFDRKRPDTRGKDVFKIRIKRIGGGKAKTRTIRFR